MGLENVIFAGQQPKSLIPKYLSITDACLIHLRKSDVFESVMPSKIFEAAGMAKPIILGVGGFARRFVLDAAAGIAIEPENEHELVDAILRLVSDPDLCAACGQSGYRHVTADYTRDTLAKAYLEIIAGVAKTATNALVEPAIRPSPKVAMRVGVPQAVEERALELSDVPKVDREDGGPLDRKRCADSIRMIPVHHPSTKLLQEKAVEPA
jgi:hypothetical protein